MVERDARDTSKTLEKAAALISAVADAPDASVSALARTVGLSRPTTTRLLRTLSAVGFVRRTQAGYAIGHEIVRLARRDAPYQIIRETAWPLLDALSHQLGEAVSIATLGSSGSAEILEEFLSPRIVGPQGTKGRPFPLHATAVGRVLLSMEDPSTIVSLLAPPLERLTDRTVTEPARLLALIDEARDQGFADIEDEIEIGLAAVSVQLRVPALSFLGAITALGPTGRFDRERRAAAVAPLTRCAAAIAAVFPDSPPT